MASSPIGARILRLAALNATQIQALDRAHTVIIIPDGIVEEHGPYLPTFTDGYLDEALAQEVARTIVARPGWNAVFFPTIPFGADPANSIGHRYPPRHYAQRLPRPCQLKGQQGFRHIFILDCHGGPSNSRALDQASAYFHDTYNG